MQPRIPRQPAGDQAGALAGNDAGLGAELVAVLAGARRRALRDGDRQIDTAHLLHSLLESDPEVCAAFEGEAQVARLLGYLVQRSIGYGLRWQGRVEDSGAVPVVSGVDGYSPLASAALEHARARAVRFGDGPPRCLDLLAGVLADPQARAVEVLSRAGIDARELFLRVEGLRGRSGEYAEWGEAGC
ncbi:Clp protease N-terminal domain-containing protein [Streptomyces sp. enrichment culture]|uniref:Clp protease N-terminal domain-containing protein n=1 Tax=Streptomyces sp. enrichment culture TaxID=1795815 RepID=UPI003F5471A2